jgi:hypothetical protein
MIEGHLLEALRRLEFRTRWITLRSSLGDRRVAIADGTVDAVRVRLYLLVFSGQIDQWLLYDLNKLIQESWERLIADGRIDEKLAHIFTVVSAGTASLAQIRKSSHDPSTVLTIGTSVIYAGLGQGKVDFAKSYVLEGSLPKLFIQKVNSRDDLERSLDVIIEWMTEHKKMLRHSMEMTRFMMKHTHP